MFAIFHACQIIPLMYRVLKYVENTHPVLQANRNVESARKEKHAEGEKKKN